MSFSRFLELLYDGRIGVDASNEASTLNSLCAFYHVETASSVKVAPPSIVALSKRQSLPEEDFNNNCINSTRQSESEDLDNKINNGISSEVDQDESGINVSVTRLAGKEVKSEGDFLIQAPPEKKGIGYADKILMMRGQHDGYSWLSLGLLIFLQY